MALEFLPLIFKNKDQPSQLPAEISTQRTNSCSVPVAVSWRGVISKESRYPGGKYLSTYYTASNDTVMGQEVLFPKWAQGCFGFTAEDYENSTGRIIMEVARRE